MSQQTPRELPEPFYSAGFRAYGKGGGWWKRPRTEGTRMVIMRGSIRKNKFSMQTARREDEDTGYICQDVSLKKAWAAFVAWRLTQ